MFNFVHIDFRDKSKSYTLAINLQKNMSYNFEDSLYTFSISLSEQFHLYDNYLIENGNIFWKNYSFLLFACPKVSFQIIFFWFSSVGKNTINFLT